MNAARKQDSLNFRITSDELELIKRAAKACGQNLSSFVIEAATYSAQKALMDQRFMHLDADVFDSVSDLLSQPPTVHPELAALLQTGCQWATSDR